MCFPTSSQFILGRRALPALTLAVAVSLLGCSRDKAASGATAGAADVEVLRGDGFTMTTRYSYHHGVPFETATQGMPKGSVDEILLDNTLPEPTLVIVTVTVEPSAPKGQRKFTTAFRLPDGGELSKSWVAADGNTSGTYRAILTVPKGARHTGNAGS
jgi:hypothetical protein